MVQKAQDRKEKEENAIYIPVILNGLLTDGSNVLIPVVLKVKVMGIESFTFCYNFLFKKALLQDFKHHLMLIILEDTVFP